MKTVLRICVLSSLVLVIFLLQGCPGEQQQPVPGQLQVSLPLSTNQVLPDTSFRKQVENIGALMVVVKDGRLDIQAAEKLPPTIGWGIYTSRSSNVKQSGASSGKRVRSFAYTSNTPALDVPAEPVGVPHIRWVEVASFIEDGDTTSIHVGVPQEQQ